MTRAKKTVEAKLFNNEEENLDEIELPGEESSGSVIVSDICDLNEDDSFILINDGIFTALGEDKVEDLLALRSDSTYIAHRLVDEAMKRKSVGDLTAMVIQIEKIVDGQTSPRKAAHHQQIEQNMKSKVDKLNKAPAVTYKYNKQNRKSSRYQSIIFASLVILTVFVMFGLIYLIINSLMDTGKNMASSPTPTVTESQTATASPSPSDEPAETPSSEPTATPTPTLQPSGEVKEHVVAAGDNINSIARKYYGDISYAAKLCQYNNISDPNKIKIGQVIKIPPKESLQ
jgi:LysM repeat protein